MARKTMTREVTKTTVKLAKMEVENGLPVAQPLEDEILIGNVSLEKAQKEMHKKHGNDVTVFAVEPETLTYELPVEKFLEIATVKVEKQEELELA